MLAGIILPSEGSVEVHGHVSSLLTLGAGFDQELSGRENILLAGAFLGCRTASCGELLPSIVEFADLGQFIDAPFKTYSSGMRARLGFAIATSVDPDILLLDEVLATGDAEFREKSKARVIELVKAAKGIVLVTHDMAWVDRVLQSSDAAREGQRHLSRATRPKPSGPTSNAPARRKAERAAQIGSAGYLMRRPRAQRRARR